MRNLKTSIVPMFAALLVTSAHAQPSASGDTVEDRSTVDHQGHVHDRWVPRDPRGLAIDPEQFYRDVGRPDLIAARASRRQFAIGSLVGALALTGLSAYFIGQAVSTHADTRLCDPSQLSFSEFTACGHASFEASAAASRQGALDMLGAGGVMLGAATMFAISSHLFAHPEPITEVEAERLAADANRRRVTSIAPYAQSGGGGLAIAGRF